MSYPKILNSTNSRKVTIVSRHSSSPGNTRSYQATAATTYRQKTHASAVMARIIMASVYAELLQVFQLQKVITHGTL